MVRERGTERKRELLFRFVDTFLELSSFSGSNVYVHVVVFKARVSKQSVSRSHRHCAKNGWSSARLADICSDASQAIRVQLAPDSLSLRLALCMCASLGSGGDASPDCSGRSCIAVGAGALISPISKRKQNSHIKQGVHCNNYHDSRTQINYIIWVQYLTGTIHIDHTQLPGGHL